ERREGFFSERVVLYVWHDSNDLVIAIGRNISKRYLKIGANRVRIREEAPRQRFVDYDDTSAFLSVMLGEIAAAQQRHMHGCEVSRRDPTMLRTRNIARAGGRFAGNQELCSRGQAAHRQRADRA